MEQIILKLKKIMLVTGLIFVAFITSGQNIHYFPALPDTIEFLQPDKYKIKCIQMGDEFSTSIFTLDGYLLVKNNDVLEYALLVENGKINPTGIVAKNKKDRNIDEIKFLDSINRNSIEESFENKESGTISFIKSFPTSGTKKLLVLLIDFSDLSFTIGATNFDPLMNQTGYNNIGSFKDYWKETSYNNLTLTSTIKGWYHASHDYDYYGEHYGYLKDHYPNKLVTEAIDAAESDGVDFSEYDNDNDGYVDGIIVVHAGYGEENSGVSEDAIWSHQGDLGLNTRTYDGVTISEYAIVPELRGNTGSNITNIGVICHEFGHLLGLPDLYDTDNSSCGIGRWGLMGYGGHNNSGATPSHLCAWSKYYLGWSNPTIISCATSTFLANSVENNNFYRINTSHSNEYFLLENRQKIGFDESLPGEGLAIWHIDSLVSTNRYESHKKVDLEEADGLAELDNKDNTGDSGDLFPGNTNNVSFKDNTNPNSQTYYPVVSTCRPISNIEESNNVIYFDYMKDYTIIGYDEDDNVICSTGSSYTVEEIPSGTSITWGESSNLTEDPDGTFSATGNSGLGYIQPSVTFPTCQSYTLSSKSVWVGTPHDLYGVYCEGGDGGPVGTYPVWTGPFYEEYDSIVWEVYPSATITEVGYGIADIYFSSPGGYQITAYCANKCEDGDPVYTYFYVYSMLMSPNPAYDEVEITIDCGETEDLKSASLDKQEYVVTISDMYGITKSQKNYSGNKFTIPVQHLKEGNYIVRLSNDKISLSKQLIIKR